MKKTFLLFIFTGFVGNCLHAQCSPAGLKIIQASCDTPANVVAKSIGCMNAEVTWSDAGEQKYLVTYTLHNPAGNEIVAQDKMSSFSFDQKTKTCKAVITVNGAGILNCTVESMCEKSGVFFHSPATSAKPILTEGCMAAKPLPNVQPQSIKYYPNPATDHLILEGAEFIKRGSLVRIIDLAGTTLYACKGISLKSAGKDKWRIGLPGNIAGGLYFLEVINGAETYPLKIVVIKN